MPEHQSSNAKCELTENNIVPEPPWYEFDLSLWRVLEVTCGLVSFYPPRSVFRTPLGPFWSSFCSFSMFCKALVKNLWPARAVRRILSTYCPCWRYVEIWLRRFSSYFRSCIFVTYLLLIHISYISLTYFLHTLSLSPELKICKPIFPVR
jgi:hypothetical protein